MVPVGVELDGVGGSSRFHVSFPVLTTQLPSSSIGTLSPSLPPSFAFIVPYMTNDRGQRLPSSCVGALDEIATPNVSFALPRSYVRF